MLPLSEKHLMYNEALYSKEEHGNTEQLEQDQNDKSDQYLPETLIQGIKSKFTEEELKATDSLLGTSLLHKNFLSPSLLNPERLASCESLFSNDRYKDMCTKFRDLNISGEENQAETPNFHSFDEEQYDLERKIFMHLRDSCQSDLHKMEEMKKVQSSSKAKCEEGAPPPWLMVYLQKMKQEIKAEILEELANSPRSKILGHPTPSVGTSVKAEENHGTFLGANVIHSNFCDNCDQLIHGVRYKCGVCPDFDLCEECESLPSLPNIHNKNHRFLKIRSSEPVRLKTLKQKCHQALGELSPVLKTHVPKKLYEAKFVCDETVPDGTYLPPSTTFIKSWRVLNSGKRVWTHSTKLIHIQGSLGFMPAVEHVDVPHLRPGEEGIVSVLFTTPTAPGLYRSHWNFCHKSRPFGDIVWCHIIVRDTESAEKQAGNTEKSVPEPILCYPASKSSKLPASGLPSEKEKEVASIAKVLTAVKEEHEKGNIIPRKLAVDSHTATPNNTPFDLTPPKSPDHQAMNELKVVVEDKESVLSNIEYDERDEESIVSLSSSDSDAEFVVIPMPNCFNLSESLASHNLSHLSQYLQSENASDLKNTKPSAQKLEKPKNLTIKPAFNSEKVSQETGVPELTERSAVPSENEQKIFISHKVNGDGSSSEISIIDSGDNSPIEEHVVPDISSIHIAVTDSMLSDDGEDSADEEGLCNDNKPVSNDKKNVVQQETPEKEDQTTDIPGSSATFPKFPVEGITSIYEPASSNADEQSVQVLPEKIVTVPLNVASTVYNATMQVMTNLRRQYIDSQNNQEGATSTANNPMDQLIDMGFCNRQQNEELLRKHKNDVALVVGELVNLNDNDWYASRHVPPSAPTYN